MVLAEPPAADICAPAIDLFFSRHQIFFDDNRARVWCLSYVELSVYLHIIA